MPEDPPAAAPPAAPDTVPADELLALLRALAVETRGDKAPPIELDSRLIEDLGVDSLEQVELNVRFDEPFGVASTTTGWPRWPRRARSSPRCRLRRGLHDGRRTIETEVPQEFAGNPDGAMTLTEVLDWHVARHPNRGHTTLLVDDEHSETLTYGQLHERARRAAAALR